VLEEILNEEQHVNATSHTKSPNIIIAVGG